MDDVRAAIAKAEVLLPGAAAPEYAEDPRWQAIIEIGEFIPTDPRPIWEFIARWGSNPDEDLRAAVATCLLEHLLEYHFSTYFPLVEERVVRDLLFADTFSRCGAFGESEKPANLLRFDALKARRRSRRPPTG